MSSSNKAQSCQVSIFKIKKPVALSQRDLSGRGGGLAPTLPVVPSQAVSWQRNSSELGQGVNVTALPILYLAELCQGLFPLRKLGLFFPQDYIY